jgi:GTP-binding protein
MEGYFKSDRDIKMAFQLIDMRHPATDFDKTMLDFLSQMGIPYTVVLTKADKLNKTETENRLKLIYEELGEFAQNTQIIPFSVQNNIGAENLRNIIDNAVLNG